MDDILSKEPMKPVKGQHITGEFADLAKDVIIGDSSDLAKLVFALKNGVDDNNWPQGNDDVLEQFLINQVLTIFDTSGEEATRFCFEAAVQYGIIELETNPQTGNKRYVLKDREELNLTHDWFCFLCDIMVSKESTQYLPCSQCPRVYHRKCCQEFQTVRDYVCHYCRLFLQNDFVNEDQTRVTRVIGFLMVHIEKQMKGKMDKLKAENAEDNEYLFVFKKMDLNMIESKVKEGLYKSINEFDDDFYFFLHNYKAQIHTELKQFFLDLRCFMVKEFKETRKCLDCYERTNDQVLKKTKDWICLPCEPPHQIVFVKPKGHPYWPAKVIWRGPGKKQQEILDVRFFDKSYSRMEVTANQVFDINDIILRNAAKKNHATKKAMEMLDKYEELLKGPNNETKTTSPEPEPDMTPNNSSVLTPNMKRSKKAEKTSNRKSSASGEPKAKRMKKSLLDKTIERVAKNIDEIEPVTKSSETPVNSSKRGPKAKKFPNMDSSDIKECPSPSMPTLDPMNGLRIDSNESFTIHSDSSILVTTGDDQTTPTRRSSRVSKIKEKALFEKPKTEVIVSNEGNIDLLLTPKKSSVKSSKVKIEPTCEETDTDLIDDSVSQMDAMDGSTIHANGPPASDKETRVTSPMPGVVSKMTPNETDGAFKLQTSQSDDQKLSTCSKDTTSELTDFEKNMDKIGLNPTNDDSDPFKGIDIIYDVMPYKEAKDRLDGFMDELENVAKQVQNDDLDEKIVILKVRQKKVFDVLFNEIRKMESKLKQVHQRNKEVETQLFDAKTKSWCAVCLKSATKFCCVRFYCSQKCQLIDWERGHSKQCLIFKKNNPHNVQPMTNHAVNGEASNDH